MAPFVFQHTCHLNNGDVFYFGHAEYMIDDYVNGLVPHNLAVVIRERKALPSFLAENRQQNNRFINRPLKKFLQNQRGRE
jgi:hypothetical protein